MGLTRNSRRMFQTISLRVWARVSASAWSSLVVTMKLVLVPVPLVTSPVPVHPVQTCWVPLRSGRGEPTAASTPTGRQSG